MRVLAALALILLFVLPAQAGIVFTPHLSEYGRLPPGVYTESTFIWTEIDQIYGRDGRTVQLGEPFVPAGDSTDAALFLYKYLWVGNIFRDTRVPLLNTRPQFCRLIGVLGYQQNTGAIAARTRLFGIRPGSNGVGDLFGLCGVYGQAHQWGPVHWNGLLATTVKFPVGRWDPDSALNIGTNYWTYIPQFAFHAEAWGRLYVDGTFAYQVNGDNDKPSFGGLTPTKIANWRNLEINFAWKWNEHWFTDIGFSYRESMGPNTYEKLTVNFKDQPLSPESACANTNNGLGLEVISDELCNNPISDQFYLRPQPGPYSDRGINARMITAGIYYVYRTSSVLQFRMVQPISGRGAEIDAIFNVCGSPCVDEDGDGISDNRTPGADVTTPLFGVQEAAAVSASPFFEIRFVHLFWAP